MGDQKADTADLQALTDSLGELVNYCTALKQGAAGFAYMLPAEWQGPAMSNFLSLFEKWQLGAEALTTAAEGLQSQADGARQAYQQTIESLDTAWNQIASSLG